ncbi:MAG: hypothetical protein K2G47_09330 [Muribaculum sp.]|nr:hypothetical protein [Muribaculum sp.]
MTTYRLPHLLSALLLLLVAVSCHKGDESALQAAESVMSERPDSALMLLEAIDGSQLAGELQARHALLLSQAYDKNYIDLTSDSLISIATAYYENHGNDHYRMMAYLYKGIVQYNANDYTNSIVSLTLAENVALHLNDYFYLGRIYATMGDLYNATYNADAQLRCRELAVEQFAKVEDKDYYKWAVLELATAYTDVNEPDRCMYILDSLADISSEDSLFIADYMEAMITPLIESGNYNDAKIRIDSLKKIPSYTLSANNYANLVRCYLNTKQLDSALVCLNKLKITGVDNDSLAVKLAWIDYYENIGDFKSAYFALKKADVYQDSIVRDVLRQSVVYAQRDFYIHENLRKTEERKAILKYVFSGGVAIILIVVWIIFYYKRSVRKKNMEISRIMSDIDDISQTVFSQKILLSSIQSDFDKQHHELANLYSGVENLYETQFSIINNICYQYFENQGSDKVKHLLYIEVLKNIEIMRNPKYVEKLECLVNNYRSDVISKFRRQFPGIKEEDIRFLTYLFAGFSFRSICLFLNLTVGNYYNKRTRLKAKILSSNVEDKELFLEMFAK